MRVRSHDAIVLLKVLKDSKNDISRLAIKNNSIDAAALMSLAEYVSVPTLLIWILDPTILGIIVDNMRRVYLTSRRN